MWFVNSRTSKTPTCVYLANRGIKAANIPLVPGHAMPIELTKLEKPLLVGLTKDPESLIEVRRNRLQLLQQNKETSYVDPDRCRPRCKKRDASLHGLVAL